MKRLLMALALGCTLLTSPVFATNHPIIWLPEGVTPVGSTKMENYDMPQFSEGLLLVSAPVGDTILHGYLNWQGNYVIEPTYLHGRAFSEGLAPVQMMVSELDANANLGIFPSDFDTPYDDAPQDTLVPRYGYVNHQGVMVIAPSFEDAYSFSEGLAAVTLPSGEWVYIDMAGNIMLQDNYTWAHDFHDGCAIVEKNGSFGVIDATGNTLIDFLFNAIGGGDTLYPVRVNKLYGLMDTQGNLVQTYLYDNMGYYQEELALAEINGLWGYVDNVGNLVIPTNADQAFHFKNGLAWVRHQGQCYYIDTSGRTVLELSKLGEVTSFSNGYARGKSGHFYGFFDKTGTTMLDFIYRDAVPVSEGIGLVYDGTLWGLFYTQYRASSWAYPYIEQADAQQIIPTYLEGTDLSAPLNRTQFAALVVNLFDRLYTEDVIYFHDEMQDPQHLPSIIENPFEDTRDPYVRRAYVLNLSSGISPTEYGAYDTLTREQAATMIVTLYQTITDTVLEPQGAPDFNDHQDIADWAKNSVYILAEKGILTGVGDNYFAPKDPISGESALIMALALCNELGNL